jgi:hypothetical protein
MNIKFDETDIITTERQIAVDWFVNDKRYEVGQATIKIRCAKSKWNRIKSKFIDNLWIAIENEFPDANWSLTRDINLDDLTIKFDGDYAVIKQSFVIGEEI